MGLGGQEDLLFPKRSKTRNPIKFLGLAFLEVNDLTQNCLRGLEGVFSASASASSTWFLSRYCFPAGQGGALDRAQSCRWVCRPELILALLHRLGELVLGRRTGKKFRGPQDLGPDPTLHFVPRPPHSTDRSTCRASAYSTQDK